MAGYSWGRSPDATPSSTRPPDRTSTLAAAFATCAEGVEHLPRIAKRRHVERHIAQPHCRKAQLFGHANPLKMTCHCWDRPGDIALQRDHQTKAQPVRAEHRVIAPVNRGEWGHRVLCSNAGEGQPASVSFLDYFDILDKPDQTDFIIPNLDIIPWIPKVSDCSCCPQKS